MKFAFPYMAFLLLILPGLYILSRLRSKKRGRVIIPTAVHLARLSGLGNNFWAFVPRALMALGFIFLVAAGMRPLKGWERVEWKRPGIDIMLLLDLSNSMRVEDAPPNRLAVVKSAARRFIEGMDNDRVGLITMTEFPLYRVPLTTDYPALLQMVENLHFGDQGMGGTALGESILTAVNRLKDREGSSKIIVMISDGAPEADKVNVFDAAKVARLLNIRIYTIGVGTRAGGPVPIDDFRYGRQFMIEPDGSLKICRLEEEALKKIAAIGDGHYFSAVNLNELESVFDEISRMERTAGWRETSYVWQDRYYWFLVPALAFLALGPMIEVWKRGKAL